MCVWFKFLVFCYLWGSCLGLWGGLFWEFGLWFGLEIFYFIVLFFFEMFGVEIWFMEYGIDFICFCLRDILVYV